LELIRPIRRAQVHRPSSGVSEIALEQSSRHTGVVTGESRFRSHAWLAFLAGAIVLAVWPGGLGHGRGAGDVRQTLVSLAVWGSAYTFVSGEPSFSPRRRSQVLWVLVAALLAGVPITVWLLVDAHVAAWSVGLAVSVGGLAALAAPRHSVLAHHERDRLREF
jgi:hypothetical protein